MSKIKNIIFDLGGVLLNIDYFLTVNAFKAIGIENFDEIYSQAKQTLLFDLLETGKITEAVFLDELNNRLTHKLTTQKLTQAWNAMLLDFPQERLELLNKVRKNYSVALLSNTNGIHEMAYEKIIFEQHQLHGLDSLFDKVYYSHRIGLRKPDRECFEYVLKNSNYKREETVFFDDSSQHIVGAKNCEIHAKFVDLKNNQTILDFFDSEARII